MYPQPLGKVKLSQWKASGSPIGLLVAAADSKLLRDIKAESE
jgi:hypothetical protein